MPRSPIKAKAPADPGLLAGVVLFKQRFCPRGRAKYDLAKPGTLVLVPEGHVLASVSSDYRAMENLIFGELPDCEENLAVLQALQKETNTRFGRIWTYFSKRFLIMVFVMVSTVMTTGKPSLVLAFHGLLTVERE